ncbi:MAG TPA: hypothetical protein VKZ46_00490 [Pedomonas sp.]|nr:hypothetical protein [Pedomonas sp.]
MHIRTLGLAAVMLSVILLLTALVSGMTGQNDARNGMMDNSSPAHDEKPAARTLAASGPAPVSNR